MLKHLKKNFKSETLLITRISHKGILNILVFSIIQIFVISLGNIFHKISRTTGLSASNIQSSWELLVTYTKIKKKSFVQCSVLRISTNKPQDSLSPDKQHFFLKEYWESQLKVLQKFLNWWTKDISQVVLSTKIFFKCIQISLLCHYYRYQLLLPGPNSV